MDKLQLLRLIDEGEHASLEFKERPAKDIAATISGLANAGGGIILLGVSDKGEILGCSLKNSQRAALSRAARDCDPPVEMDIDHMKDENVFVLTVKQSVVKPVQCSKGYFLRENAETRKLTSEEAGAMMRKSYPLVFDNLPCEDFAYPEDFSLDKFKRFTDMASLSRALPTEDILVNLKLAKRNKKDLELTNAAALLFASDVRKFFVQAFVSCVVYNGESGAVLVDRKDFRDGIIADIENAAQFAERSMRVGESIKNRYRTDIYEYPREAVKEALVNACAHRDWAEQGGQVMLEMFPGRMRVRSPGGLPEGVTLANIETVTKRRNPLICDVLQKAGLSEQIGSGILRMKKACKDEGSEPPKFEDDPHFFQVSFTSNPATRLQSETIFRQQQPLS